MRPPAAHALCRVDPEALGHEVTQLARRRAAALVDPAAARTVVALAAYARAGTPVLASSVRAALDTLIVDGVWMLPHSETIATVATAAVTRESVDAGQRVTLACLGVLASLGRQAVDRLVREGEIATVDGELGHEVEAVEARRWLASRGVPGFVATEARLAVARVGEHRLLVLGDSMPALRRRSPRSGP